MASSVHALTWGLAIATYQRVDSLLKTIEYALRQTRPPIEVVVADSSSPADVESTAARIRELIEQLRPGTRLQYIHSSVAQQTVQRNVAARAATADVLFMIDDDSFMHPTCAQIAMEIYEQAPQVVAITPGPMHTWPPPEHLTPISATLPLRTRLFRLVNHAYNYAFTAGPEPRPRRDVPRFTVPTHSTNYMEGNRLTVRRSIALRAPFDENLASGHFEDGDGSLSFLELGVILEIDLPLIFHEAAPRPGGMARRSTWARYGWTVNLAYLQRKRYGDSLWVRSHAFLNLARFSLLDLVVGALLRRDLSKFKGCMFAFPTLVKMAFTPQPRVGELLVKETHRTSAKINRRPS